MKQGVKRSPYVDAKGRPKARVMVKTNASEVVKPAPGASSRRHVIEIMAKLFGWQRFVEVGVWKAGTSVYLLENCPDLEWHGVDPYAWQPGSLEQPGWCDYRTDMDKLYRGTVDRLRPFGDRARLHRASSVQGAELFEDGSLDAVFIDGDHRYENVTADIAAWRPKVRGGGWLMGHDVNMPPVRQAVDEAFPGQWTQLPDVMWAVAVER